MIEQKLKPVVKWAGGKNQLLEKIRSIYPKELGTGITKYAEPFVGGGAVLFDILSRYSLKEVYISDINAELINMYICLRDSVEDVIAQLLKYESEYLPLEQEEQISYYYYKREQFNRLKLANNNPSELAALFIFLNRTCFNGLYRVNKKGEFNVPIGSYKRPVICNTENLIGVSNALADVKIICGDYIESESFIDDKTFAYFDPPYKPLSPTSNFTSYSQTEFGDEAQIALAKYIQTLSERGAYIAASNSDPKNKNPQDDFFDKLYSGMKIYRISASRMINCKADSRGKISELLICNNYIEGGVSCMKRDFDNWLGKFRPSISGYDYYVNFNKVVENVELMKVELNILNTLIGSKNIEDEFENIIARYPDTLRCIPLLLAVRNTEIYAQDEDGEFLYSFDRLNYSIEQYKIFMRKTGLFDIIANHIVNNLVDYALGVETGLNSNSRKNRGGDKMENLVEAYLQEAGFKKEVTYFKEMYLADIESRWDIDLSALSNHGKAKKRFDFVVKTNHMIYAIETNFYSGKGGGSKLNETARSYKMLAQEADTVDGFTFVWFTDGTAWKNAKENLRETFDVMENLYSIDDMKNGIMSRIFV